MDDHECDLQPNCVFLVFVELSAFVTVVSLLLVLNQSVKVSKGTKLSDKEHKIRVLKHEHEAKFVLPFVFEGCELIEKHLARSFFQDINFVDSLDRNKLAIILLFG